ncbi:hypothetical protein [Bacillus cereus]|uniref:hypothetical protein n=1 Tax=Bacillus cereus TaxID=1396 RepID=UPI003D97C02F
MKCIYCCFSKDKLEIRFVEVSFDVTEAGVIPKLNPHPNAKVVTTVLAFFTA